jgi:adenylate cyclase
MTGRTDDSVAVIADAMRIDPHHPTWYWTKLGVAHFAARRYAEAIAAIRNCPNPEFFGLVYLAACHAQLNKTEDMRTAAAELLRSRPASQ